MHNKKLNISPAWVFRTDTNEFFEPVLFRLLESIRDTGKLTMAATATGISYRHAWNLLNRGGDTLGLPLVVMRKGHEIGRASCRERGQIAVWDAGVVRKE